MSAIAIVAISFHLEVYQQRLGVGDVVARILGDFLQVQPEVEKDTTRMKEQRVLNV
ncbi:hypothetical protein [Coleofasciculus sp. G2-EDA-02]|uniref:hypothetical protein n=1 Tax=Coleofasciculus sp. G2-EDA-02 TaxID=3069529 RepID=UPI003302FEB0